MINVPESRFPRRESLKLIAVAGASLSLPGLKRVLEKRPFIDYF